MINIFDYIIVGAGSAGCVLANRLSENKNCTVLLLEAGGSDKGFFIRMPSALSYPMNNPKLSWSYTSDPEPYLGGRVINCPRGRVMGGTSSINGMVYVRGHANDFDEWQKEGARVWSYSDCLPYFCRAENWIEPTNQYRGSTGPLHINVGNAMQTTPLYQAFIDAGIQAGYPYSSDYNGYRQESFSPMKMTVKNGVRCSTSLAYISTIKHRKNLHIRTRCWVEKILLKNKVATGLVCTYQGKSQKLYARREVILSAGTINSPALLQLSGIGPASTLKAAGVNVIHHLPGVGRNLQDHLEVWFQYKCSQPVTLNNKLGLISKAMIAARWLTSKKGLGATNHFESCAFIRSQAGLKSPDIQYHFLPGAMSYDSKENFKHHGYQVHVGTNKPKSRGRIEIKSNNFKDKPSILFNYLSREEDRATWRRCFRLTREIMNQPAFDPYNAGVIQPNKEIHTDQDIDQWITEKAESAYHPAGTCKMGNRDDKLSVVDNEGKVIGLESLRVVDASIFPTLTNGNINAPTIMLAEKLADAILGRPPLASSQLPIYYPENWQKAQR